MKSVDIDAMFSPRSPSADVCDGLEPLPENSFAVYGDFALVGHGKVTNKFCGTFWTYKGCLRVELHNRVTIDGENYSGKVFVRKARHWCHKSSCPICFKSGWAVREAGNIKARLTKASKFFGKVEHIVASVPVRDYGLSFEALRRKVVKVLKSRGVLGGVLIFHGFRYNLREQWYWSPHFHVLGFIKGGYGRCRQCRRKWNCLWGCGGFDDRAYQSFLEDGYYVKVLGERKTIFGTAWYQLNHSSIDVTKKRFHVATWFGVVSYRKLKLTAEKHKALCPICKHELVRLRYFGKKRFVLDDKSALYERESFEDLEEDGQVVWVERVRHGGG